MNETRSNSEYCQCCVYYPPNLPENAYSSEDYLMLQSKDCAFDFEPMDKQCQQSRKSSCSLIDLEQPKTRPRDIYDENPD